MLQLPDNNRLFAALPAQYSAACDRRLSLFGVSRRGNFVLGRIVEEIIIAQPIICLGFQYLFDGANQAARRLQETWILRSLLYIKVG